MQAVEVVALVPAPSELVIEWFAVEGERLVIVAAARHAAASCPVCGCKTGRVHSRYERRLADLPWHGLAVALRVRVRRFVCEVPRCPRQIFCERLPATAAPYARRTARLGWALELIGLALGGEAGARLARALGMATSPDTVLRALVAQPPNDAPIPTVRVLGVDDWAWRKGQRYGTLLVDLERRRVLDLLPDREPETLAAWLRAHAGVAIISRDRAGAYAEGATRGAPNASQVADRFHLLRNVTDAVLEVVDRHRRLLRAAHSATHSTAPNDSPYPRAPVPHPIEEGGAPDHAPRTRDARAKAAARARRLAQYERVIDLHAKGLSGVAIAREVGLVRQTVMRWLRAGTFPERRIPPLRRRPIDAHAEYLRRCWAEGCHSTRRLWRELRERGFRGGRSATGDWIRTHLGHARGGGAAPAAPAPPARALSARRAAWLLSAADERLSAEERAYVDALCAASPELAAVRAEAHAFAHLVRNRDAAGLTPWLPRAATGPLAAFARGLRRDETAVRAALTEPWSNGQVDGQVHRLKLVKRTMYGRAGFALLRRRVLAA
jgi:transposase